ncbi:hypothetical protein ACLOJK_002383 [Asimina triloba]
MGEKKHKKSLIVAPFECAWRKELRFKEAGRGCVSFEASAHNDVTVVFREQAGSQHYHYKRDNSPNYTIIFGSHRNRRLKIEVNGKSVVDVAGIGLCCSSEFQSYWISIYDGLICIGSGRYPFQNLVFEWLDSNPNCNVQYVGLSSWDKHVGYRNVNVLPLTQHHACMWKHLDHIGYEGKEEEDWEGVRSQYEGLGLGNFLERWDLSDMLFLVGLEEKPIPAHKVVLGTAGNSQFSLSDGNVIRLPSIMESQLSSLRDLGLQFQVFPLVRQCDETIERFKMNKRLFDSGKKVELTYSSSRVQHCTIFPWEVPFDVQKLKQLLLTGEHGDLNIYIDGYGPVARAHKLILSLWSVPFMKMFTNGMSESNSPDIYLRDVSVDAFLAMLQFMYSGELEMEDKDDTGNLLLQLLLLSDQFGVTLLQQECCNILLECLSEDSLCPILQIVSSIPSCKLLEETCERNFSRHFNYCSTASTDFVFLDKATFVDILQHPDLTVTSEERVLDAILLWCMQACEILGWEAVDELLKFSTPEHLFGERLQTMETLLPFVRFPLMPSAVLKKVNEAVNYSASEMTRPADVQNERFQHRRSSFKELQYICDGDNNGVIYFAGTSYGEHQWVNPVLAKKITVAASSPASRYTDPKALVSRTYQATSFAGPRTENGQNRAWWMVDIGQDHQQITMIEKRRDEIFQKGNYAAAWLVSIPSAKKYAAKSVKSGFLQAAFHCQERGNLEKGELVLLDFRLHQWRTCKLVGTFSSVDSVTCRQ